MSDNNIANASASAERLMRAYHKHSLEPDPDTLFALLEAGRQPHQLVPSTQRSFSACARFFAGNETVGSVQPTRYFFPF